MSTLMRRLKNRIHFVNGFSKIKVSIFIEIRYLLLDFQLGFLIVVTLVATKFCITVETLCDEEPEGRKRIKKAGK